MLRDYPIITLIMWDFERVTGGCHQKTNLLSYFI